MWMNARLKKVQDSNPVPFAQKMVDGMGADKTGATRDENTLHRVGNRKGVSGCLRWIQI